jgi:DNA topoisomerase-1
MSKESGAVWRREGTPGKGFTYLRADGAPLRSRAALGRIRSLAIPPAWTDVEIAADAGAKVQATGCDSEGRKQYIYHPRQVERRQKKKYGKLLRLAQDLPRIRQVTAKHLKRKGVGRERVLATIVRLMLRGYFRVGSERYAEENKTFGIATLQKRHLAIEGDDLIFRYPGKHSIAQRTVVADTPLVEVMREILELPGKRLFRYADEDGKVKNVTARDVNAYIKEIAGDEYSSKDFRTWGGTVRAASILADLGPAKSRKEAEKAVVLACKLVSSELGNTPAVCRSSYIHPVVLEKYLTGKTIEPMMRRKPRSRRRSAPPVYYPEEAALMRFLDRWG